MLRVWHYIYSALFLSHWLLTCSNIALNCFVHLAFLLWYILTLVGVNLQYDCASIVCMLVICFTRMPWGHADKFSWPTLFSYNFLWLPGIALTLIGVGIVSVANIFSPPDEANGLKTWLPNSMFSRSNGSSSLGKGMSSEGSETIGILVTLLSSVLMAGRLVAEEIALDGTDLHPFQV